MSLQKLLNSNLLKTVEYTNLVKSNSNISVRIASLNVRFWDSFQASYDKFFDDLFANDHSKYDRFLESESERLINGLFSLESRMISLCNYLVD